MVFRDSLKFFNMALEKLPATFNLQEMYKGFFAYSWIRPEKYDYVGEYAPVEDYHPERMTEKRRKEFLTWHKEKVESNAIFDFQKELSAIYAAMSRFPMVRWPLSRRKWWSWPA